MGRTSRIGDLQISYDPKYEEREWLVQKICWILMALLALGGLLGLFGPGRLSETRAGSKGSRLQVKYDKFARYQGPAELEVTCRPEGKESFRLTLNQSYLAETELKEIIPEPVETISAGEKIHCVFKRTGEKEETVILRYESQNIGRIQGELSLDEKETVLIHQFMWP